MRWTSFHKPNERISDELIEAGGDPSDVLEAWFGARWPFSHTKGRLMETNAQVITDERGRPQFVVLPAAEYERLCQACQEASDSRESGGKPNTRRPEGLVDERAKQPEGVTAPVDNDVVTKSTEIVLDGLRDDVKLVVSDLASRLNETQPNVLYRLGMIVELVGEHAVRELADEAATICAHEGMKTKDGSRDRTVGGVFFELVRQRLSDKDRKRVFGASARLPKNEPNSKMSDLLLRVAKRATRASLIVTQAPADNRSIQETVTCVVQGIDSLLLEMTNLANLPRHSNATKRPSPAAKRRPVKKQRKRIESISRRENKITPSISKFLKRVPKKGARILTPTGGKKPGSHSSGRHS
jgi:hypothetical protein